MRQGTRTIFKRVDSRNVVDEQEKPFDAFIYHEHDIVSDFQMWTDCHDFYPTIDVNVSVLAGNVHISWFSLHAFVRMPMKAGLTFYTFVSIFTCLVLYTLS